MLVKQSSVHEPIQFRHFPALLCSAWHCHQTSQPTLTASLCLVKNADCNLFTKIKPSAHGSKDKYEHGYIPCASRTAFPFQVSIVVVEVKGSRFDIIAWKEVHLRNNVHRSHLQFNFSVVCNTLSCLWSIKESTLTISFTYIKRPYKHNYMKYTTCTLKMVNT